MQEGLRGGLQPRPAVLPHEIFDPRSANACWWTTPISWSAARSPSRGARIGNRFDALQWRQIIFMDRDEILNLYIAVGLPVSGLARWGSADPWMEHSLACLSKWSEVFRGCLWSGTGSNCRPSALQQALRVDGSPSQITRAGSYTLTADRNVYTYLRVSTTVVSKALAGEAGPG